MATLVFIIVSACYLGIVIGAIIKFKEKGVLYLDTIIFALLLPIVHFFIHPIQFCRSEKNISIYKKIRIILASFEFLPVIIVALAEVLVLKRYAQANHIRRNNILEDATRNQYDEMYGCIDAHFA